MTGVFLLAAFAVGVIALGHAILGLIFAIPFRGRHAAEFWVLTGASVTFGLIALFFHLTTPTTGVTA